MNLIWFFRFLLLESVIFSPTVVLYDSSSLFDFVVSVASVRLLVGVMIIGSVGLVQFWRFILSEFVVRLLISEP